MNDRWTSAYREIPRAYAWMAIAAAGAASTAGGFANDFIYDDIPLIRDNPRVQGLLGIRDIFANPYWPPPFVEQLYRPLTLVGISLQYTVGTGQPVIFRLVSYLLYVACGIALFHLAVALVPRRIALGMAVLFVVHPVHVEAVALGVNQAELLVTLVSIACVSAYIQGRRAGALSRRRWAVLALLYAAATLCKETGFVIPGLLLAAEVTLIEGESMRSRAGRLWLGYLLLAGVAIGSFALRVAVLPDGAFHVVPTQALRGLGAGARVMTMLTIVPEWLRLFVWPVHLEADYAQLTASSGFGLREAVGLLILIVLLASIVRSFRRAPVVTFGLLWCAIGLAPVSNIIPTGVLLAERTLFLPSVGFFIAVAGAADRLFAQNRRVATRQVAIGIWTIALVFGIVRSESRELVWNSQHLRVVPAGPPR